MRMKRSNEGEADLHAEGGRAKRRYAKGSKARAAKGCRQQCPSARTSRHDGTEGSRRRRPADGGARRSSAASDGRIDTGSVTVTGMLRICVASLRVIPGWILPDETPSLSVSSGSIVNS